MGYVIIALNIVIICILLDIRMNLPDRDYVEEAMIRDAKRRGKNKKL